MMRWYSFGLVNSCRHRSAALLPFIALPRQRSGRLAVNDGVGLTAAARHFSTSALLLKSVSPSDSGAARSKGKREGKKNTSVRDLGQRNAVASTAASATAFSAAAEEPLPQHPSPTLSSEAAAAAAAVTLARSGLKQRSAKRGGGGGGGGRGANCKGAKSSRAGSTSASATPNDRATATTGRSSGKKTRSKTNASSPSPSAPAPGSGNGKGRDNGLSGKRGTRGGGEGVSHSRNTTAAASAATATVFSGARQDETESESVGTPAASSPQVGHLTAAAEKRGVLKSIHDPYASAPLYYTENTLAVLKTTPTKAELIAERARVTKLFLVSSSVAMIFSAQPHDQRAIDGYLDEVNRAVPPTHRRTDAPDGGGGREHNAEGASLRNGRTSNEEAGSFDEVDENLHFNAQEDDPLASYNIMQRVLVEQSAEHTLHIHVRNMEQLVPPANLLQDQESQHSPAAAVPASSEKATGGRRGRRGANSWKGASTRQQQQEGAALASAVAPSMPQPLTAAEQALRTLQRIKALNGWKSQAALLAAQSQNRWALPDDCHCITNVRMSEPYERNLAVVLASGFSKSVDCVLRLMRQNSNDEDEDGLVAGEDDLGDMHLDAGELSTDLGRLNAMGELAARLRFFLTEGLPLDLSSPGNSGLEFLSMRRQRVSPAKSAPFVLKPLLTVYASCVPRRETVLGHPVSEALFRAQSIGSEETSTQPGCHPQQRQDDHRTAAASVVKNGVASSTISSSSPVDPDALSADTPFTPRRRPTDEEVYRIIRSRGVPEMPRYSTRITLLVEHNELESSELLSLAEIATTRTEDSPSGSFSTSLSGKSGKRRDGSVGTAGKAKRKKHHMYCLIVDGGAY